MPLDQISFINDTLFAGILYGLVCLSFVLTAKYLRFPDLTCSGSFVLGAAISALCIVKGGINPVMATLLAVVGGGLAGTLTAFFYTVLRLDRLLCGILSAFTLYSVNVLLLTPTIPYKDHATLLSTFEKWDAAIDAGGLTWHPYVIIFLSLVVMGTKLLLDRFLASEFGLALRSLEDEHAGEYALEREGFSPALFKLVGLALGNGIVAGAGALMSYKDGSAYADRGFDLIITGLVAFMVGTQLMDMVRLLSARLSRRRSKPFFQPNISSFAILGAIVYFGLITLSQRLHVPPEYTKVLLVGLVALSVAQPTSLLRAIIRRTAVPGAERPGVLLSVQSLSYRYPSADTDALKPVSFNVRAGTVTKLSGGNGSGKTTALRVLAGFLDAIHGGRILYKGRDLTEIRQKRLERIAYVDQNAQRGVVGCLSTEENLALSALAARPSVWRRALNRTTRERVRDLARLVGLADDVLCRRSDQLSGGQRQVVNLLGLLSRKTMPQVVLLDEPTNNLDARNADRCRQIIEKLHDNGAAIVLVSHTPLAGLRIDDEIEIGNAAPGPGNPVAIGTHS